MRGGEPGCARWGTGRPRAARGEGEGDLVELLDRRQPDILQRLQAPPLSSRHQEKRFSAVTRPAVWLGYPSHRQIFLTRMLRTTPSSAVWPLLPHACSTRGRRASPGGGTCGGGAGSSAASPCPPPRPTPPAPPAGEGVERRRVCHALTLSLMREWMRVQGALVSATAPDTPCST